jgi:hypothetical protein
MTTVEQALFDAVLADLAYLDTLSAGMEETDFRREAGRRITLPLAEQIATRFDACYEMQFAAPECGRDQLKCTERVIG